MASYLLEIGYTCVTLILLTYFLRQSFVLQGNTKRLSLHWILFGFIFNTFSFSILYTAYPLPWTHGGVTQFLGITTIHLVTSFFASLGFFIVALSAHKRIPRELLPFAFGFSLTLAEAIRSIILSILYYGKGATIAFHFTGQSLGNALSTTPLIEFAYFGGTFGLTCILGYLVYIMSAKKKFSHYWSHGVGIGVILFCVHTLAPVNYPTKPTTVGVITTNFQDRGSTLEEHTSAEKIHELTLTLSPASFFVYPEDTRYLTKISKNDITELEGKFPKTLFIEGETIPMEDGFANVSFLYSPSREKKQLRGKEFLYPFGEYIPYAFNSFFSQSIGVANLAVYKKNHNYIPLTTGKTTLFEGVRIGTLICSEIISYSSIQSLHKENPEIVFFQSRLQLFHNNPWFIAQMRSLSKITAATLRTTIVSANNGAPSFIVSPYGAILKTIPIGFSTSTFTVTENNK